MPDQPGHHQAHQQQGQRKTAEDDADLGGGKTEGMRIDRQIKVEQFETGFNDGCGDHHPPQRRVFYQIQHAMLGLAPGFGLRPGQQPRQKQQHQDRQRRQQREQQIGRTVTDEIDRESRGGGPQQRGQSYAQAENAVVAGAVYAFSERTDEVLHGDRVKDIAHADQRRRDVQSCKPRHHERQQQPQQQPAGAEQHGRTETVAVRQFSGVYRQEYRKQRIHRKQHADGEGIRAEIDGIQRNQHLAALEAGVGQHRHQHDQIEAHLRILRPG
jgi:hypothetical protein